MSSPKRGSALSADSNVTIVLHSSKIAWLDRLAVDIRLRHGKVLTRGQIVRAIIEAASLAPIDLSDADSATAMATLLNRSWPKRSPA